MNTHKQIILITLTAALFSGCAYTAQVATLKPTVSIMQTSEGAGVTVSVRVLDERPSKSLGRRGTGFMSGAEITSTQDIEAVVQAELIAGLKAKGFTTSAYSESIDTKLTIEIRLLEYSTSVGFWTAGVHVNAALKAIASKNGQTYEKMYRSEDEKRVMFVPGAASNEKMLNKALSDILSKVLDDQALINHLAN